MLLETIRCENGSPLYLPYHQERLTRSLSSLNITANYTLSELVIPPESGTYRCRFLYDDKKFQIEFHPYVPRAISSVKILHCDTIDYPLKFSDRDQLASLYSQRGESDDVLIIRNGMLTDTTIANIALKIGNEWLTPQNPLLEGTTRARLIKEGLLTRKQLSIEDIQKAEKIAVMNAMLGFIEVENGIIT